MKPISLTIVSIFRLIGLVIVCVSFAVVLALAINGKWFESSASTGLFHALAILPVFLLFIFRIADCINTKSIPNVWYLVVIGAAMGLFVIDRAFVSRGQLEANEIFITAVCVFVYSAVLARCLWAAKKGIADLHCGSHKFGND